MPSFATSRNLVPALIFVYNRVFWFGPMVGGVLATLVWESILRP
ncbi:unnamed protein product, partial [Laminaria digitata]